MFKKILSLALAAVLAVSMLVSCGGEPKAADVSIDELHTALKDAFGEQYYPNTPLDAQMLEATYGVKPEWVEEFVAEIPMIMVNIDTLIIVKPTEGNQENVEKALTDYLNFQKEDGMAYPKDVQKIQAAEVYTEGGYVFFFMIGTVSDDILFMEGEPEEIEAAQYAAFAANTEKAKDTVHKLFFPNEK